MTTSLAAPDLTQVPLEVEKLMDIPLAKVIMNRKRGNIFFNMFLMANNRAQVLPDVLMSHLRHNADDRVQAASNVYKKKGKRKGECTIWCVMMIETIGE